MVICAAVRIKKSNGGTEVTVPCWRHSCAYGMLHDMGLSHHDYEVLDEGFITTDNLFLDRKEAYRHALSCGQMPAELRMSKARKNEEELFSEDLY